MFVSICAYFGKVRQLGREMKRVFKPSDFYSPSFGLKRKIGSVGPGFWMLEEGGYWLTEDGGKWKMEGYK